MMNSQKRYLTRLDNFIALPLLLTILLAFITHNNVNGALLNIMLLTSLAIASIGILISAIWHASVKNKQSATKCNRMIS